ncbi:MAG: ferrous iron transport protein A [Desulfovibrio sp.]|nr:ferrous iron transport protein A [Desulfovibrio sp.]
MQNQSALALTTLKQGEQAMITQVRSHGALGRRIRSMGLLPGMTVTMMGKAPMGDPLALRVANTTVALRKREAAEILIVK